MSYTHYHLPELDDLKKILTLRPEQVKYYMKYGAILGSSESIDYLKNKIDEYNKNKSISKRV